MFLLLEFLPPLETLLLPLLLLGTCSKLPLSPHPVLLLLGTLAPECSEDGLPDGPASSFYLGIHFWCFSGQLLPWTLESVGCQVTNFTVLLAGILTSR